MTLSLLTLRAGGLPHGPVVKTVLPMQRVQIQLLFSELRFYTLHGAALNQQKQQNSLRAGLSV